MNGIKENLVSFVKAPTLLLKTLTLKSIIYWTKMLKEVFLIPARTNTVPLPPEIYIPFAHKFFKQTQNLLDSLIQGQS